MRRPVGASELLCSQQRGEKVLRWRQYRDPWGRVSAGLVCLGCSRFCCAGARAFGAAPRSGALFGSASYGAVGACGLYALGAAGAVAVPPLTTCEKIEAYACELAALRRGLGQRVPRGMPAVLESLPHVAERAASPAEAAIALLLSLPADAGGFGLPAASLNQKIVVAGSEYVCDLAWNDGACLLEYQGETHKRRWRRASDRRKHNALRGDGKVLFEAGRDDLMTFAGMNQLASVLADVLGASLPPATKEALQRRIDLRAEVLECFSARI